MADLDIAGMAGELGVPESWVRDRVKARAIPHHRYGKHVRFTAEDVAEFRRLTAEATAKAVPLRSVRAA
jgi:excisionase family DNA binding protein